MSLILGLLSYIPGFLNLATSITTTVFNAKVQMYQARTGATRDVAVAAITAEVTNNQTKVSWIMALASNPVMLFIVFGFAMPWIIYEWKVVVYDNVWAHWGAYFTPPIAGNVGDWAGLILSGIFVTSGGIGLAHAIVNRKD